jgi:hypothetical protein
MEAQDVVMEVLHKKVTDEIVVQIKRGPKGYGLLLRLRLLLYATLKKIFFTRELIKHLQKRPSIHKKLGFKTIPSRRTVDRWKDSVGYELQQIIRITGDRYLKINDSEWTIIDSTPMVDEEDPESTVGYNSQGAFTGFKLHMSCDEHEVPLRATVTQAHIHDSQKADELMAPTPRTGGDCAYDAKEIKQKAKNLGSKPIFGHNPRRLGKAMKKKTPKILRRVRVCIEQCNGFIKGQVMKHSWTLVKGLKAKAVFALTAVLAIQGIALYNLNHWGYPSIRIQEVRI